jgi:hypothetical protein
VRQHRAAKRRLTLTALVAPVAPARGLSRPVLLPSTQYIEPQSAGVRTVLLISLELVSPFLMEYLSQAPRRR